MVLTLGTSALEREAPAGSLVDLVYRNEAGEVSRRRVEIVRWSHAGNGFTYLRAYCFLREEERTFRADRILEWRVAERGAAAPAARVVAFVPVELPRPTAVAKPVPTAEPVRRADAAVTFRALSRATSRAHGRRAVWVAVTIVAAWAIYGLAHAREPPASRYVPAPAPKPAVTPARKPSTVAPQPGTGRAGVDGRAEAFRRATGIVDPALEALYRGADRDGGGTLDWSEIAAFQSRLDRTCEYRANERALRPDEFVAQGGGDCEDWALFACGLLRYWGWDPYVGSFAGSEHGTGHAVCLARVADRPDRFRAWSVDADGSLGGVPVKAGWYVPIDYEVVGDLSNAVEDGWRLRSIRTPEPLYGERM